MNKAIIFDIQHCSALDGPGIRTIVFFKGCSLKCAWCHNPESQSFKTQMMFYKDRCVGCGRCLKLCPSPDNCTLCSSCAFYCPAEARRLCGKEYTVDKVFDEIIKDKLFYENSGGGVTFSGGECMLQIDFLCEILKKCKENGIHTALDSAGYVPFENFERVFPYTNLFLYDIKMLDSHKHKQYTGVGNELILDNLKRLFSKGARIWIRIPVIADVNDTIEEMQRIKAFLDVCGKPEKVELLPYHELGGNKYRALGKKAPFFKAPEAEKMKCLKSVFE